MSSLEPSDVAVDMDSFPTGLDTVQVALVSGGMDSAVSAAVSDQLTTLDFIAYLDTGTGLDENREYIEDLADELGVQFWTLRTHVQYEELVQENGFPGPSRHGYYYNSLKDRQVRKLDTITGNRDLVLWTGVRSLESQRRMRNVDSVDQDPRGWHWVSPIHDWSKDECEDYLESHDLPKNDLWSTLGRSGDCFCGCYGSPEEKLDLEAAGCGYHSDWLDDLEERVETGDQTEIWGWGALSESEQRAARAERDDSQMLLCSTCSPDYPVSTDGGEQ